MGSQDLIVCNDCGEAANTVVQKGEYGSSFTEKNMAQRDAVVKFKDGDLELDKRNYDNIDSDAEYPLVVCGECGNKDTIISPHWDENSEYPMIKYLKESDRFTVGESLLSKIRRGLYE